MYRSHKDFPTPGDSVVIWHYFSLSKFIGFFESSQLYFSRQDRFDDSYEGSLSKVDIDFLTKYSRNLAEHMISDQHGCFYANCWTMSDSDEYVLWNTYASLKDGVAIKSTVGQLIKALEEKDSRSVYISSVNYFDEKSGSTFIASGGRVNLLAKGFSKRKYFSAEKELRLLFWDNDAHLDDNSPQGVSFHVDLRELIDSIYVAPQSYPWFQGAISHLISLYGLSDVQVNRSTI